jgi:anti-sigma-K factor RskA
VNIQDYISSGIIESYVLGIASHEEQLEFERLCGEFPEIQAAKDAFEQTLENHSLNNAVLPPPQIKKQVLNAIHLTGSTPQVNISSFSKNIAPVRRMNPATWVAAASVILLVASTVLNFYFYSHYQSSIASLKDILAKNNEMASNNQVLQTKLLQYQSSFDMIKDTNMAVIALKGEPVAPAGHTTVYWDKRSKDVYVLVNNLPRPASDKQYQLWAIVDGKPVDAGTLDLNDASSLVKMKNIPRAQAFAITLEKKGGSQTPTMPIYVQGAV